MSIDFNYFYDFFVFCGDLLGQMSTLAIMPFDDSLRIMLAITNDTSFTYVNLFTGISQPFIEYPFNSSNALYEWLINNLVPAPAGTPFVLALVYTIFLYGFGFTVLKWALDFI